MSMVGAMKKAVKGKVGPGGHRPDGTGPHGRGMGPGRGRGDGSGMGASSRKQALLKKLRKG